MNLAEIVKSRQLLFSKTLQSLVRHFHSVSVSSLSHHRHKSCVGRKTPKIVVIESFSSFSRKTAVTDTLKLSSVSSFSKEFPVTVFGCQKLSSFVIFSTEVKFFVLQRVSRLQSQVSPKSFQLQCLVAPNCQVLSWKVE